MEQEILLSTLKEKVGNTPLSDRSLNDYISNNLPLDGAEPDDAYWAKHVQVIKSLGGNFAADLAKSLNEKMASSKGAEYFTKNTEALKAFIKEHPELLDSEAPKLKTATQEDDQRIKALEEKLNKMMEVQEQASKKNAIAELKSSVLAKASSLNVTRKSVWEDAIAKVSIEDGETQESLLAKVKAQYASDIKRHFGDGEKPYSTDGNPGGGNGGNNQVIKDFFAKKKAKMGK